MQKLIYINLNNERLAFEGKPPFVLSKVSGLGLPAVNVATLRGTYQHGETATGFTRASRHVDITAHLFGEDRADMYRQRMNALSVLSPDKAVDGDARGILIYENDFGRWQTYAIPESGLEADRRLRDIQPDLKVSFRCESPYWYDTLPSEVEFTYSGDGFTLPFSFPISFGSFDFSREVKNAGQVDAPVEVWIEGKGEKPSLLNRKTGKRLALTNLLPNGSTLYMNTDPARLIATISDGSTTSNAFGLLDPETPLGDFTLRPGMNTLVYEPGGASAQSVIKVRWRNAYEGV